MKDFLSNEFFWGPIAVSFLAQLIKFIIHLLKFKKLDVKRLVEMGGFPSAHSASVSCLSILTGLNYGFGSALFGIVSFFSLIVMYDAAGIRKAAGEQARVLNTLLEEILKGYPISEIRLQELLGHTIFEVITGAIFGGIAGWLIYKI